MMIDVCTQCGGSGEMRVPQTYMTCPCCRGRDKFRPCKACHGKGVEHVKTQDDKD